MDPISSCYLNLETLVLATSLGKKKIEKKEMGVFTVLVRTGEGWDREVFLSPHFSYSSDTIYREDETKARKQVCMCIDVTVKELLRP